VGVGGEGVGAHAFFLVLFLSLGQKKNKSLQKNPAQNTFTLTSGKPVVFTNFRYAAPRSIMTSLSVLVPVFNEERTLKRVMAALSAALPESQIIYVDDGSADSSLQILKADARPQDLVLTKKNGGKGSAIREAIRHSAGTYTVIQDADLEYDPFEIKDLLSEAQKHPGAAVFGSRFLKKNPNIYPLFLIGNKVLTWIINLLFRSHLTDSYTCFKLFPTEALKKFPLKADGFDLEVELSVYPLKFGVPIREVPISYHPRSFAEGKKISWRDALKGIFTALKIRLSKTRN